MKKTSIQPPQKKHKQLVVESVFEAVSPVSIGTGTTEIFNGLTSDLINDEAHIVFDFDTIADGVSFQELSVSMIKLLS